jgi:pimeloyl-ACP methyl ester carboxylesterase
VFLDSVLPFLAEDIRFVLDRIGNVNVDPTDLLGGHLDLERVGIIGMSMGGILAAEACLRDARLAAGLLMDVWVPGDVVAAGLRLPVMWLSRDAATMRREGWDDEQISNIHSSIRSTFERLPGDGYIVLVPGMHHIDFSDGRLLSPLIAAHGISGPIDGRRAGEIVRTCTVAFFDRHLKGAPSPLLDERSGLGADLSFESRRAAQVPATA